MSYVHIHAPPSLTRQIKRLDCPTCDVPRPMIIYTYEWYGASITCLGCGERWQDGEMMQRPFMPRWRDKSVTEAKAQWRRETAKEKTR